MSDNFPGARWWKVDFHNHTPASSDFDASEKSISERQWLLAYMRAGMDAVMVTDHNCADWIERLQNELATMRTEQPEGFRALVLYSGIEITTHDNVHVLAIFGPETMKATLDGLLVGKLTYSDRSRPNAERMCEQSTPDVIEAVHRLGGLAIAAHVDRPRGLLFEDAADSRGRRGLSERQVADVLSKGLDAFEVEDLASPFLNRIPTAYHTLARVIGSDAPHRLSQAGKRFTWVKMSRIDLDGLRFALLDPEQSIRRFEGLNPQSLPRYRIVSLQIEQLAVRRTAPLTVKFSPWYTAVIGGRGQGKSTLVESLRLALGRDDELSAGSDAERALKDFVAKKDRGRDGMMLPDSRLSAIVDAHSDTGPERWRLTWQPGSYRAERWADAWVETPLTANDIKARVPVSVYSQKQLFHFAKEPQALIAIIDRALGPAHRQWQAEHRGLQAALEAKRRAVRALQAKIGAKVALDEERKVLERKALVSRQANYAERLRAYHQATNQRRAVDDFTATLQGDLDSLQSLIETAQGMPKTSLTQWNASDDNTREVEALAGQLSHTLATQTAAIQAAAHQIAGAIERFRASVAASAWAEGARSAIEAYEKIVAEFRAQGISGPDEAANTVKRLEVIKRDLDAIAVAEADLESAKTEVIVAHTALRQSRERLSELRQNFVDSVLRNAQIDNLQFQLHVAGDIEGFVQPFRSSMRLADGTFVPEVFEQHDGGERTGLLGSVGTGGTKTLDAIDALKQDLEDTDRRKDRGLHGKFSNALDRCRPEDWDALWALYPEDRLEIRHRSDRKAPWRDLRQASAGQKTAAILSFILAYGNEPLILDQPEDDLDNALVQSLVVAQIRANKARRQLIVVTHNANIVVNGDAELVQPMEFAKGEIHAAPSGGLQEQAIRQQVCDVMEGGRKAFAQRYKRILDGLEES